MLSYSIERVETFIKESMLVEVKKNVRKDRSGWSLPVWGWNARVTEIDTGTCYVMI